MSLSEEQQKILNKKKILHKIIIAILVSVLIFSLFQITKKIFAYYKDDKQYKEIRAQVSSLKTTKQSEKVTKSTLYNTEIEQQKETDEKETINQQVISSKEEIDNPKEQNDEEIEETEEIVMIENPQKNNESEIPDQQVLPYILEEGNAKELNDDGIFLEYSKLKEQNSDLIGWLEMPGFKKVIDYPLMYSGDNEYYLDKDFYKNYSYAGSIFMDGRNNPKRIDKNIVIYGHAMRDYSMFGNIKKYSRIPDNYINLTKIYLDFMNTRLEYEVFSTYYEEATYNYRQTNFNNDDEYINFLNRIASKSVYDYGVVLSPLDKIITFSTCTDSLTIDERSVVHARLISQKIYSIDGDISSTTEASLKTVKKPISANVYLLNLSLKYSTFQTTEDSITTTSSITTSTPLTPAITDNLTYTQIKFKPLFNTISKEFNAVIPSHANIVSFDVKTADPKAQYTITFNEGKVDKQEFYIDYGKSIIKIKVISQDGLYARTYTIIVTRTPD